MSSALRIFVVVIGSFEQPCYAHMLRMRRQQLEARGIPHLFLLDGEKPADYALGPCDMWIEKNPAFDPKAMNPHMIVKFLKGLRTVKVEDYDYIVRVNASTYIQFPALFSCLEAWPRGGVVGGYLLKQQIPAVRLGSFQFASGMCMIFSSDVARYLQELPLDLDVYKKSYDDVILGHLLLEKGFRLIHTPVVFHIGDKLQPVKNGHMLYRVRHPDRKNDVIIWRELLKMHEGI